MADHAWCHDPDRDEAVRAAEDGRTGPLPTLEEAIAVFSPSEEGLRTERVTLEIVRGDGLHVRQWPWHDILKAWGLGEEDEAESVRVVEDEPSSDADAEVLRHAFVASEIQRLKADAEVDRLRKELEAASGGGERLREQVASIVHEAMRFYRLAETARWQGGNSFAESRARQAAAEIVELMQAASGGNPPETPEGSTQAASGGGEGEPVAFVLNEEQEAAVRYFCTLCGESDPVKIGHAAALSTLLPGSVCYRPPQPATPQPRGWLTEEQRNALRWVCSITPIPTAEADKHFAALRALRARSSPPEVVKPQGLGGPKLDQETTIQRRDRQWTKALAAIGVAVKEVGD
jgi:hypothetical protein